MTKKLYILVFAALLMPLCAMAQSVDLQRGLVAYYPFEGNANDASGNGNNGRPEGATFEEGNFGKCCCFGGYDNSQIVRVPNSNSLRFSNAVTFAFWFTLDDYIGMDGYGRKGQYQHMKFFAKDFDRGQICAGINGIDENSFRVEICNDGKNCEAIVQGNATKKWYHAAMVLTTGSMKIYINGKEVASKNVSMTFNNSNGNDLILGRLSQRWYPLHGCLDEFRVYNRELNSAEIAALFSNAKGNMATYTPSATAVAQNTVTGSSTATTYTGRAGRNAPKIYKTEFQKTIEPNVELVVRYYEPDGVMVLTIRYIATKQRLYCNFITQGGTYECKPEKSGILNLQHYTSQKSLNIKLVTFAGKKYDLNWEIDLEAIIADYLYKKALKGKAQEEVDYLKVCPYDDHKAALENDIVNNKTNKIGDIAVVLDGYPALKDRLKAKMLAMVVSVADCQTFMKYYAGTPEAGRVDDKLYSLAKESISISDCDSYLNTFPNGKHAAEIRGLKTEIPYYEKARNGGIPECTAYLTKYPNGHFSNQIRPRKQRLEQLAANSNKATWKQGNKICHCKNNDDIIMLTLDQWNEDKSAFKGIVVASPGGTYEGNSLKKGNQLWVEPKGWHKCLEDEVSTALANDKSQEDEAVQGSRKKDPSKMKFPIGSVVKVSEGNWLLNCEWTAQVEDWNDDYTQMFIHILSVDGTSCGDAIRRGDRVWADPSKFIRIR